MSDNFEYVKAYWVKQLSNVQLPALAGTIRAINAVTQDDDSSVAELAEIILRDSALTARVLQVANSVYHYRSGNKPINTISRAVVQLGFRPIKAISLSVMIVDSLLKQEAKERMLEWMARSFHAGVQARNLICRVEGDEHAEEVFISSLLMHLGELTFWAYRNDIVDQLDRRLEPHSNGNSDIEREILGISLKGITRLLAEAWGLEEYLQEALNPSPDLTASTRAVLLGEDIGRALEKGWDSPTFKEVLGKVSAFTGSGPDEARQLIEESRAQALEVAISYGANRICHLIPGAGSGEEEGHQQVLQADLQLQLDVLRDMSAMVEKGVDTGTLFRSVIEAIHRGIGLERTALCLLDARASSITARYVLGNETEEWSSEMTFPVVNDRDNLLAYSLLNRQSVWMQPGQTSVLDSLINRKTQRLITTGNLLLAPVYAGNRPIGLMVADRGKRQTPIAEAQKESFDYFAQQLSGALALLVQKRGKVAAN